VFDRYVRPIRVGVLDITVCDTDPVYLQLINEIPGAYTFEGIHFEEGDVMLDIGAHVGLTSIYFAKLFPGIRIYAYEPVLSNYERLLEHIELNGVGNVHPHNLAVTGDGGRREFVTGGHTAGHTAFHDHERDTFWVESTTIPAILKHHKIKRVKLLKLDCEGAEFEILGTSAGWLHRVDAIRGEIHTGVRSDHDPSSIAAGTVPDVRWVYA
jgi:FkbM family methyltransferase